MNKALQEYESLAKKNQIFFAQIDERTNKVRHMGTDTQPIVKGSITPTSVQKQQFKLYNLSKPIVVCISPSEILNLRLACVKFNDEGPVVFSTNTPTKCAELFNLSETMQKLLLNCLKTHYDGLPLIKPPSEDYRLKMQIFHYNDCNHDMCRIVCEKLKISQVKCQFQFVHTSCMHRGEFKPNLMLKFPQRLWLNMALERNVVQVVNKIVLKISTLMVYTQGCKLSSSIGFPIEIDRNEDHSAVLDDFNGMITNHLSSMKMNFNQILDSLNINSEDSAVGIVDVSCDEAEEAQDEDDEDSAYGGIDTQYMIEPVTKKRSVSPQAVTAPPQAAKRPKLKKFIQKL